MITVFDIERISLGLVNRCNLACPLCYYVRHNIKEVQKTEHADINAVKNFLDKLPNIRIAIVEGNYSEPTFYKHFKELVKYLKLRNIRIRLSTNGNTFNAKWWSEIGMLFEENDVIRFAVEGTTQELHSKYRVKGDLNKVLENHREFKKNSRATTVLQNVVFEYNYHDQDNIKKLFLKENFDFVVFQKCCSSDNFDGKEGIVPLKTVTLTRRIFNNEKIKNIKVVCDNDTKKEIYINHEGQIFRCNIHEEERPYKDIVTIYDDIDTIFEEINLSTEKRHDCNVCIKNCNAYSYKIGEYHPTYIFDKNLNEYKENYLSMEVEPKNYWNKDKLI